MNVNGIFSHVTDHWSTPVGIYSYFKNKGFYDPCPLMAEFDGLISPWDDMNFVNPPYSNIRAWIDKAISQHRKFKSYTVLLIPARVETKWFAALWDYGCDFFFLRSRFKFGDSKVPAPFASMFCVVHGGVYSVCHSMSLSDFFAYMDSMIPSDLLYAQINTALK